MDELVRAAAAALAGERVSVTWDRRGLSTTFNWDNGRWFWAAFDRKAGRTVSYGRAATIEAAIEQALDLTSPLAAE